MSELIVSSENKLARPAYQVMPDLTADEYKELKDDIQKRGVMVPIEYDEQGNVLDGHHRLKICAELGIKDFPKVIRAGMTEEEKRTHARKLNMARRQLNREQIEAITKQQIQETPELSDRQIARDLGGIVSNPTVSKYRKELEKSGQVLNFNTSTGSDGKEYPRQVERKPVTIFNPTSREEKAIQNPDVVERMAETGSNVLTAEKHIRREEKASRKAYKLERELPTDACRLYNLDIRNGLSCLEDNSVDYIITDPPYPKEYIPLYGNLSEVAQRVLKPGGSLIVMCGQSYLPEVMQELCKRMKYHWCMAYETPGGQSPQLFHKKVNTFWKPVIWFTKGDYSGEYVGDVLKSPVNQNDKRYHEWGQSLGGMVDIVERFTNPGDIILDPFLGGGTTGVAAVTMGRKFIGADIENKNVVLSMQRIKEAYSECQK